MSKHNKPYHNYNNYSANKSEVKVEETVVEPITATEEVETVEVTEEIEVTEPTVEEPVVETTELAIGVVNCKLLRVRSEADSTADNVICEIEEGSEVQINEAESTSEFYKVVTTAGAEGFCMKKFITIK